MRGKKVRILREPISTITSTLPPGSINNKNTNKSAGGSALKASSSSSSGDTTAVASGSGSGELVVVKQQQHIDQHSLDQELGYNDGKGSEGVLRRVYDSWSLTSIAVANIGPVAGGSVACPDIRAWGPDLARLACAGEYRD